MGSTPVLMFHKPGVPQKRFLTVPDLSPGTGPGKTSWPQSNLSACEQGKANEITCIDTNGSARLAHYTIANGGLVSSFDPLSAPVSIGSIIWIDVSPAGHLSWAGKVTVNGKDRGAFVVVKPNGQVHGPFQHTAADVITSLYNVAADGSGFAAYGTCGSTPCFVRGVLKGPVPKGVQVVRPQGAVNVLTPK